MTVDHVFRRAAAIPFRRSFKPASVSLSNEALTALYGALRKGRELPGGPQDEPAVRLHSSSNRRQARESEMGDLPPMRDLPGLPNNGTLVYDGHGGNFAGAAAAAASRALALAQSAADGEVADVDAAAQAARDASDAAASASAALAAARQAARASSGDAGLARAAAEAEFNAKHALHAATIAQAAYVRTCRIAVQPTAFAVTASANRANATANAAIDAAADRLEAAGGPFEIVAALRALHAADSNELFMNDNLVADEVFDQAIEQAGGDAELVDALVKARDVRNLALDAAATASDANWPNARLMAFDHVAMNAVDAAQAAEQGETGLLVGALVDARRAADRARGAWVFINEDLSIARELEERALVTAQEAGLLEVPGGAGADALAVAEPEGEPGEADIGGTDVTIDEVVPARADTAADAALTEAGTAAGAAAHTDLRTTVDTHGPADRAAIAEAAEASLWKRSQALAAQMLEHPNVKSGLRLTGRGLEDAALAAMVYGLAKAIHTDVKNGDHEGTEC